MYVPERNKLQGLSLEVAECYGKPHIGAWYVAKNDNINSYRFDHSASCPICGKPVTNAHHCPPKRKGLLFLNGHTLKPSLIALCGSGTTGCHGMLHNGKIKINWKWFNDEYARMWWDGELLEKYEPHSEELYQFGEWEIKFLK